MIDFTAPSDTFMEDIEKMVKDHDLSYLDSIIEWCERRSIDPEHIASFISSNMVLKAKLQLEAESLNILPKSRRMSI